MQSQTIEYGCFRHGIDGFKRQTRPVNFVNFCTVKVVFHVTCNELFGGVNNCILPSGIYETGWHMRSYGYFDGCHIVPRF